MSLFMSEHIYVQSKCYIQEEAEVSVCHDAGYVA